MSGLGGSGRPIRGSPAGPLATRPGSPSAGKGTTTKLASWPALRPGGNGRISAELIAAAYKFGRADLDEFAARSHRLAAAGAFAQEIVPVQVDDTSDTVFDQDETIRPGTTSEKLAGLPAAFHHPDDARRFPEIRWNVTAGNS